MTNLHHHQYLFVATAVLLLLQLLTNNVSAFSATSSSSPYDIIQNYPNLLDPITGEVSTESIFSSNKKHLIVLLPQLGEFDSSEYCEFLVAAQNALEQNNIELRIVGIGNKDAALEFCNFTGLSPSNLKLDPSAALYKELGLYAGPEFAIPDFINDDVLKFFLRQLPGGVPKKYRSLRPVAAAWLNYNAMCAGIGAPGTLREILRGYFGDATAPERFRDDDVVKVKDLLEIGPGVGPTRIGNLKYNQWFADEKGYQRPVELATVRLKNMVEVLTKWDTYIDDEVLVNIAQRGGTFLFDTTKEGEGADVLYEYKSQGVLTYSKTMSRPLTFLSPYIGKDVALNPLGLRDTGGGTWKSGRGILKPIGKAMNILSLPFKVENKVQAKALGADDMDIVLAKKEIEDTISSNKIVIYTYGLSPFSSEALAVLDEAGLDYTNIEVGQEWFLLNKEQSAIRSALLDLTDQSSLPHVFIDRKHIGGLFTGSTSNGKRYPGGLAGLRESGALDRMMISQQQEEEAAEVVAAAAVAAAKTTTLAESSEEEKEEEEIQQEEQEIDDQGRIITK